MKRIFSLFIILILIGCASSFKIENSKSHNKNLLNSLNGKWIQEADSLSELSINDNNWNFDQNEIYSATVTDSLEQFKSKLGFIILVKDKDTLYFELLKKTKNNLDFARFPSGKKTSFYKIN